MAQLRPHITELEALNACVVVISFGSALGARAWLKEMDVLLRLLLDPERVAYRAYDL